MSSLLVVALIVPLFSPGATGPGGLPGVLQDVRIGDVPLIPDTGMTPPIALVHPRPVLDLQAVMAGVDGTVTVLAQFDIDGNFRVLEVVESLGYDLDQAALAALETWIFRPAYRSGRRVPVVANIEVEFEVETADGRILLQALQASRQDQVLRARLLLETLIATYPSSPLAATALRKREELDSFVTSR